MKQFWSCAKETSFNTWCEHNLYGVAYSTAMNLCRMDIRQCRAVHYLKIVRLKCIFLLALESKCKRSHFMRTLMANSILILSEFIFFDALVLNIGAIQRNIQQNKASNRLINWHSNGLVHGQRIMAITTQNAKNNGIK